MTRTLRLKNVPSLLPKLKPAKAMSKVTTPITTTGSVMETFSNETLSPTANASMLVVTERSSRAETASFLYLLLTQFSRRKSFFHARAINAQSPNASQLSKPRLIL
jgi:hypothetical protein